MNRKYSKIFSFVLLCVSTLFLAYYYTGSSDAVDKSKLIGKWDCSDVYGEVQGIGFTHYKADGSFDGNGELRIYQHDESETALLEVVMKGEWEIVGNKLSEYYDPISITGKNESGQKLANDSMASLKELTSSKNTIIKLDDNELVTRDQYNVVGSCTRLN